MLYNKVEKKLKVKVSPHETEKMLVILDDEKQCIVKANENGDYIFEIVVTDIWHHDEIVDGYNNIREAN